MPLDYVRPSPELALELEEVAAKAAPLREYLAAPNIPLDSFPSERLQQICVSLERLPQGTAEGCRAPLAYARIELPRIRRKHVLRASEVKDHKDAPPSISREDRLDLLLKDLIVSVSTALAQYQSESASEIPDGLEPEPPIDATKSDPAEAALHQSEALIEAVIQARPPVEKLRHSGVALAETLGRQLTDIESNTVAARAELKSDEAQPRQLEMLAAANRILPEIIERTGIALEKAAVTAEFARDVSRPLRDWIRNARRDGLNLVISKVKEFGKALQETARAWRRSPVDDLPTPALSDDLVQPPLRDHPPAEPPGDFNIDQVHEMIREGRAPPSIWVPWIRQLEFKGEKEFNDLLPLTGLTALRQLNISRTGVQDLRPIATLTNLKALDIGACSLIDLAPLVGLTELEKLSLIGTEVTNLIPLAGLLVLQELHLDLTEVSDLTPLAGLTALQELGLTHTQVTDLSPLEGLTALRQLDLDHTPVRDLTPLAGLTALRGLRLSYAPVTDLTPLMGLAELREVVVENAPRKVVLARTLGKRGGIVRV